MFRYQNIEGPGYPRVANRLAMRKGFVGRAEVREQPGDDVVLLIFA